jgi:protein LSM14
MWNGLFKRSQPQYPPPSSLVSSNGGATATGSSPPLTYMGTPPSQYRGAVPPIYPPAALQSWDPSPPLAGANGTGLGMPMYWQGYYRPPPAGHMQHQPILSQPPPLFVVPPRSGQQQQQGPNLLAQLPAPALSRPPGPVTRPSSSDAAGWAFLQQVRPVRPALPLQWHH